MAKPVKPPKKKYIRISVTLDEETLRIVDELAPKAERTRSGQIRAIIKKAIKEKEE